MPLLAIRGQTISFAFFKSRLHKRKENKLIKSLDALERKLCNIREADKKSDIVHMIATIYKEIQLIFSDPKIIASMARARIQCYEEGENLPNTSVI